MNQLGDTSLAVTFLNQMTFWWRG